MYSLETIKTSSDGNFRLCKKNGVGREETPFEELVVVSENLAEKHVIEIRLDSNYIPFNGQPVKYTYYDVYIAHGMRGSKDSIEDIKEYITVLEEAVKFATIVKDYIESSDEWSRN